MDTNKIKELSFEDRIEWMENHLENADDSDDFKPLLMRIIFSDNEIEEMKTMTKRLKNLKLLLDNVR